MKVIILGVTGLLGHQVYQMFKKKDCNVIGTMRGNVSDYSRFNIFAPEDIRSGVCFPTVSLDKIILDERVDAVINCIGITKHTSFSPDEMIQINSVMPQYIARKCKEAGSLFVQISTDCVFSGFRGLYSEIDHPDDEDIYGRSKILGEVEGHLVIRTSFIGNELLTRRGLLEWFLSQTKTVQGFTNAMWNGISSIELSKVIYQLILNGHRGLIHVGGQSVSKFSLLQTIRNVFEKDINVVRNDKVKYNRTLLTTKFDQEVDYCIPSLLEMIKEIRLQKTA